MPSFSLQNLKERLPFKFISLLLAVTFISSLCVPPSVYAQGLPAGALPPAGAMIAPTAVFQPALIKGVTIHPENPLKFDFLIDRGDTNLEGEFQREEYRKMVKYFLASLTVPEEDLWVNLSPYEKDRMIPEKFGVTEMGRDLLAQDYILKQLTASLMYPEDDLGKAFWNRVYKKAHALYGTTDIPLNTFNKVWIVPERAVVFERGNTAFVADSHLRVMLEEDYIALERHNDVTDSGQLPVTGQVEHSTQDTGHQTQATLTTDIIREIIIPELEREVNEGQHFVQLRQIYNALILATWYKQTLKESLLGQVYVDQNKITGLDLADKTEKEKIYAQYIEAFKKGVYDYIKEDYDPATQSIVPRKYFSGGAGLQVSPMINITNDAAMLSPPAITNMVGLNERLSQDKTLLVEVDLREASSQGIPDLIQNDTIDYAVLTEGGIRDIEEFALRLLLLRYEETGGRTPSEQEVMKYLKPLSTTLAKMISVQDERIFENEDFMLAITYPFVLIIDIAGKNPDEMKITLMQEGFRLIKLLFDANLLNERNLGLSMNLIANLYRSFGEKAEGEAPEIKGMLPKTDQKQLELILKSLQRLKEHSDPRLSADFDRDLLIDTIAFVGQIPDELKPRLREGVHAMLFDVPGPDAAMVAQEDVGARIARFRKEKDMAVEELALAIGSLPGTLMRWEVGETSPVFEKVIKISEVLEKSLAEIYTGLTLDKLKEKFHPTLGERIRELRLAHGWTQEELARRMGTGVHATMISSWERNTKPHPLPKHLRSLSQIFNLERSIDVNVMENPPEEIAPWEQPQRPSLTPINNNIVKSARIVELAVEQTDSLIERISGDQLKDHLFKFVVLDRNQNLESLWQQIDALNKAGIIPLLPFHQRRAEHSRLGKEGIVKLYRQVQTLKEAKKVLTRHRGGDEMVYILGNLTSRETYELTRFLFENGPFENVQFIALTNEGEVQQRHETITHAIEDHNAKKEEKPERFQGVDKSYGRIARGSEDIGELENLVSELSRLRDSLEEKESPFWLYEGELSVPLALLEKRRNDALQIIRSYILMAQRRIKELKDRGGAKPTVVIVHEDASLRETIKEALGERFNVRGFPRPSVLDKYLALQLEDEGRVRAVIQLRSLGSELPIGVRVIPLDDLLRPDGSIDESTLTELPEGIDRLIQEPADSAMTAGQRKARFDLEAVLDLIEWRFIMYPLREKLPPSSDIAREFGLSIRTLDNNYSSKIIPELQRRIEEGRYDDALAQRLLKAIEIRRNNNTLREKFDVNAHQDELIAMIQEKKRLPTRDEIASRLRYGSSTISKHYPKILDWLSAQIAEGRFEEELLVRLTQDIEQATSNHSAEVVQEPLDPITALKKMQPTLYEQLQASELVQEAKYIRHLGDRGGWSSAQELMGMYKNNFHRLILKEIVTALGEIALHDNKLTREQRKEIIVHIAGFYLGLNHVQRSSIVRLEAVRVLENSGYTGIARIFIERLDPEKEKVPRVRKRIIEALGKLALRPTISQELLNDIVRAITKSMENDPHFDVQKQAAETLYLLKEMEVVSEDLIASAADVITSHRILENTSVDSAMTAESVAGRRSLVTRETRHEGRGTMDEKETSPTYEVGVVSDKAMTAKSELFLDDTLRGEITNINSAIQSWFARQRIYDPSWLHRKELADLTRYLGQRHGKLLRQMADRYVTTHNFPSDVRPWIKLMGGEGLPTVFLLTWPKGSETKIHSHHDAQGNNVETGIYVLKGSITDIRFPNGPFSPAEYTERVFKEGASIQIPAEGIHMLYNNGDWAYSIHAYSDLAQTRAMSIEDGILKTESFLPDDFAGNVGGLWTPYDGSVINMLRSFGLRHGDQAMLDSYATAEEFRNVQKALAELRKNVELFYPHHEAAHHAFHVNTIGGLAGINDNRKVIFLLEKMHLFPVRDYPGYYAGTQTGVILPHFRVNPDASRIEKIKALQSFLVGHDRIHVQILAGALGLEVRETQMFLENLRWVPDERSERPGFYRPVNPDSAMTARPVQSREDAQKVIEILSTAKNRGVTQLSSIEIGKARFGQATVKFKDRTILDIPPKPSGEIRRNMDGDYELIRPYQPEDILPKVLSDDGYGLYLAGDTQVILKTPEAIFKIYESSFLNSEGVGYFVVEALGREELEQLVLPAGSVNADQAMLTRDERIEEVIDDDFNGFPAVDLNDPALWLRNVMEYYGSRQDEEGTAAIKKLETIIKEGRLRAGPDEQRLIDYFIHEDIHVIANNHPHHLPEANLIKVLNPERESDAYNDYLRWLARDSFSNLIGFTTGVISTSVAAFYRNGLFDLFKGGSASVTMREIERHLTSIGKNTNKGYIHGVLYTFAKLGWVKRGARQVDDTTLYTLTEKGKDVLSLLPAYARAAEFSQIAVGLNGYLTGDEARAPPVDLDELVGLSKRGWDLPEGLDPSLLKETRDHLNGFIISPILTVLRDKELGISNRLLAKHWIDLNRKAFQGLNKDRLKNLFEFLEAAGFVDIDGDTVWLTARGEANFRRTLNYGVPVSYYPTYHLAEVFLFGDPHAIERFTPEGYETLVNRFLNTDGSDASHAAYFKKVKEAFESIVNERIETNTVPLPAELIAYGGKPYTFVIADTGSGKGGFLLTLYETLLETGYGDLMREHPDLYQTLVVGIDFNKAARENMKANFEEAGVPHAVLDGDISQPQNIIANIKAEFERLGIEEHMLVHIRSMLDHNRRWTGVRDEDAAREREPLSSGVFAWRGEHIPNNFIEQNLKEHFEAWGAFAEDLIIIELHTADEEVVAANLRKTLDIPYYLSHLYSDQFTVERPVFMAMAEEAGFDVETLQIYPADESRATVGIYHLTRDPVSIQPSAAVDSAMLTVDKAEKVLKKRLAEASRNDDGTLTDEGVEQLEKLKGRMAAWAFADLDMNRLIQRINYEVRDKKHAPRAEKNVTPQGHIVERYDPIDWGKVTFARSQEDARVLRAEAGITTQRIEMGARLQELIGGMPGPTPLERYPVLDQFVREFLGKKGIALYLKREDVHEVGSFKFRALIQLYERIDEEVRRLQAMPAGSRPTVTIRYMSVSTGNQGRATVDAVNNARKYIDENYPHLKDNFVLSAEVTVPFHAKPHKKEAIQNLGGYVVDRYAFTHPDPDKAGQPIESYTGAEDENLRKIALNPGENMLSPHADPYVIAGYSVIVKEILRQLREDYNVDVNNLRDGEIGVALGLGSGGYFAGLLQMVAELPKGVVEAVAVTGEPADLTYRSLEVGHPVRDAVTIRGVNYLDGNSATPEQLSLDTIEKQSTAVTLLTDVDALYATALLKLLTRHQNQPEGIVNEATSALGLAELLIDPAQFKNTQHMILPLTSRNTDDETREVVDAIIQNAGIDGIRQYFKARRRQIAEVAADRAMTALMEDPLTIPAIDELSPEDINEILTSPMDPRSMIGKRIRIFIRERGLTIVEFSQGTLISKQRMPEFFSGNQYPNEKELMKIGGKYGNALMGFQEVVQDVFVDGLYEMMRSKDMTWEDLTKALGLSKHIMLKWLDKEKLPMIAEYRRLDNFFNNELSHYIRENLPGRIDQKFVISDPGDFSDSAMTAKTKMNVDQPTILFVDDESSQRQRMKKVLRRAGFTVVTAENGLEALYFVREDPHISLVITDYIMGDMLGNELAQRLYRENPELPVMIWTNSLNRRSGRNGSAKNEKDFLNNFGDSVGNIIRALGKDDPESLLEAIRDHTESDRAMTAEVLEPSVLVVSGDWVSRQYLNKMVTNNGRLAIPVKTEEEMLKAVRRHPNVIAAVISVKNAQDRHLLRSIYEARPGIKVIAVLQEGGELTAERVQNYLNDPQSNIVAVLRPDEQELFEFELDEVSPLGPKQLISRRIKGIFNKRDLTVEQMAGDLRINRRQVERLLKGESFPNRNTINRLAGFYDPGIKKYYYTIREAVSLGIRTLRIESGMTQSELAKKVGISVQSISFIENGRRFPREIGFAPFNQVFDYGLYPFIHQELLKIFPPGGDRAMTGQVEGVLAELPQDWPVFNIPQNEILTSIRRWYSVDRLGKIYIGRQEPDPDFEDIVVEIVKSALNEGELPGIVIRVKETVKVGGLRGPLAQKLLEEIGVPEKVENIILIKPSPPALSPMDVRRKMTDFEIKEHIEANKGMIPNFRMELIGNGKMKFIITVLGKDVSYQSEDTIDVTAFKVHGDGLYMAVLSEDKEVNFIFLDIKDGTEMLEMNQDVQFKSINEEELPLRVRIAFGLVESDGIRSGQTTDNAMKADADVKQQDITQLDGSTLGDRIQRLRTEAGLTQEGLAEKSKLSIETIWNIENHLVQDIRPEKVKALAEGLRRNPSEVYTGLSINLALPRIESKGGRIKVLRLTRGLTREDLAAHINSTEKQIAFIERSTLQDSAPISDKLHQLAGFFYTNNSFTRKISMPDYTQAFFFQFLLRVIDAVPSESVERVVHFLLKGDLTFGFESRSALLRFLRDRKTKTDQISGFTPKEYMILENLLKDKQTIIIREDRTYDRLSSIVYDFRKNNKTAEIDRAMTAQSQRKEYKYFDVNKAAAAFIKFFEDNGDQARAPSNRQMAERLGVGFQTVNNHYKEMIAEVKRRIEQGLVPKDLGIRIKNGIELSQSPALTIAREVRKLFKENPLWNEFPTQGAIADEVGVSQGTVFRYWRDIVNYLRLYPDVLNMEDEDIIVNNRIEVAIKAWEAKYGKIEQILPDDAINEIRAMSFKQDKAMTAGASSVASDLSLVTGDASHKPQATSDPIGGIDLNPARMNLQIRRDNNGVPLPVNLQPIETMRIDGFVPVIINITPVTSLPMLSGLFDGESPRRASGEHEDYRPSPSAYLDEHISRDNLSSLN